MKIVQVMFWLRLATAERSRIALAKQRSVLRVGDINPIPVSGMNQQLSAVLFQKCDRKLAVLGIILPPEQLHRNLPFDSVEDHSIPAKSVSDRDETSVARDLHGQRLIRRQSKLGNGRDNAK